MKYVIRIAANDTPERDIEELLARPVGQPLIGYKSFLCQAESWPRVICRGDYLGAWFGGSQFPPVQAAARTRSRRTK